MKKALIVILTLCMVLSLAACGDTPAKPSELYTTESDFVEAGYEGDCINTNRIVLMLGGDGNYILEQGFFVNQIMGNIVFQTKTVYTGTYTAGEPNADGIKTVTLDAPTGGFVNMNGVVTTAAEDAEFLADFAYPTLKVDTNMGVIVLD